MKKFIYLTFAAVACMGITLMMTGCSDDDIMGPPVTRNIDPNAITNYFPVDAGFTSTYEVRDADGRTTTNSFRVGGTVPFGELNATQWFYEVGSGYDTSYIVVIGSSLYLYESPSAVGERILQGPLNPGATWTRYPGLTTSDSTIVTGGTDIEDILNGEDSGNGGVVGKVFPTTGSNVLRVERVETITLNDGVVFSGAAKVVNQLSNGSTNQYWFAPGFGLVRYVIGATQSYPNGQQVGELVSFSK